MANAISISGEQSSSSWETRPYLLPAFTVLMVWVLVFRLADSVQVIRVLIEANTPIPVHKSVASLTLAIPFVWLLLNRLATGKLLVPYWKEMFAFQLVILARETVVGFSGGSLFLGYGYTLLYIYAGFFALVNTGISDAAAYRVRKAFIIAIGCALAIVVGSYFTPIRLSVDEAALSLRSARSLAQGRMFFSDSIHPNALSYAIGAAGAILLYTARNNWGRLPWWGYPYLLAGLFVTFSYASRGGSALLLAVIVHHMFLRLRGSNGMLAAGLLLGLGAVAMLFLLRGLEEVIIDRLYVAQRFLGADGGFIARTQQIIATWEGFKLSPVWGNGFAQAGATGIFHQTRSNFHATQMLSSYGLVGFTAWAICMVRIFLTPPRIQWALVAGVAIAGYNWSITFPLAVIAYLVYVEKHRRVAA